MEIYNHLSHGDTSQGIHLGELDISRSSSHGSQHKLSISTYQGVRLMDCDTRFQDRHKLMLISFILLDT